MPAVETRGLKKSFKTRIPRDEGRFQLADLFFPRTREVQALQSLDLRVERGEMLAFLGPNGAGKSTTIKLLTGILHPDAGEARVLGLKPWKDRKALGFRIGSVFGQKSQLWFHLPPSQSFEVLAAIYEIPRVRYAKRRDELVDRFGLGDYWSTPVRKLSLGQRIRCEIAASFLHEPEILFLDEPTIGLDVVVKQEIRALLLETNREQGTTVFLTSHDIGDVEKLCRRAIIIHHGCLVLDEALKTLRQKTLSKKRISVRYASPVDFSRLGTPARKIREDRTAASFEVENTEGALQKLITGLSAIGDILDLKVEDEPLEQIVASYFRSMKEEVKS